MRPNRGASAARFDAFSSAPARTSDTAAFRTHLRSASVIQLSYRVIQTSNILIRNTLLLRAAGRSFSMVEFDALTARFRTHIKTIQDVRKAGDERPDR